MVIDSYEHIMFPVNMQLDKMDEARGDKMVSFCTAPGESRYIKLEEENPHSNGKSKGGERESKETSAKNMLFHK